MKNKKNNDDLFHIIKKTNHPYFLLILNNTSNIFLVHQSPAQILYVCNTQKQVWKYIWDNSQYWENI